MVRSVLLSFILAGTLALLASAQEPASRPQAQILWPDAETYLSGPILLAASIEPPVGGGQRHVLGGRPPRLHDRTAAIRMRMGRRFQRRVSPGAARGRAGRRGPHRANGAHQGAAVRGKSRRGCRPGDRDRDRRGRAVRSGSSAVGVSRVRRREPPDNQLLHVAGRTARAGRGRRHQREHGAGDVEAEIGGPRAAGRRAREEPGDAARDSTTASLRSHARPPTPPSGYARSIAWRRGVPRRCTTRSCGAGP